MNQQIANRLHALFSEFPFMRGVPVSTEEASAAETKLGVTFSSSYKEFICTFGGAMVGGHPVYGLRRAEPMDIKLNNVIDVTKHFQQQSWPEVEAWYIVSMDHAGNPIGLDSSGRVLSYDHDSGKVIEVAQNFEQFLWRCLSSK